jgi:hypothetical protein
MFQYTFIIRVILVGAAVQDIALGIAEAERN